MTLLEAFIANVMRNYQEPERKGVQRGDEIGTFTSRFKARLYSLYNFEAKEIARRVGISYSFFRRIKTEENFDEHVNDFIDNYLEKVFLLYMLTGCYHDNCFDEATFNIDTAKKIAIPADEAFRDACFYRDELKGLIAEILVVAATKNNVNSNVDSHNKIISLLSQWEAPELNMRIFKAIVNTCDRQICEALNDPEATEEKRNQAVICSNLINKLSTTL